MESDHTQELWDKAKKAQSRVQAYFDSRSLHQHDIDGIKQLISDATFAIVKATEGKSWAKKASDPVSYIAKRIHDFNEDDSSLKQKTENRFALEMLADELGIKDDMLKALAVRQGGASL